MLSLRLLLGNMQQARLCVAGHVTAGGSICIEALTLSGTAGSWTSQYNMEAILNIVILNMIGRLLFQQHLVWHAAGIVFCCWCCGLSTYQL